MTTRRSACLVAALLAITIALDAEAQVPADSQIPADPYPVSPTSAALPQPPSSAPDRPTQLPNIDSRSDITPLIRDPGNSTPRPRWNGPPSDYDPSKSFLPDSNPGTRQPPCPCLPLGTFWVDAGYFLGKTQSDSAPPLLTQGGSGIPGTPGVSVLQGNDHIDHPFSSGFRLETGFWLNRCQTWGVEGSFFYITSSETNFQASSTGSPLLARPYNTEPGNVAAADVLAAPGTSSGWAYMDAPLSLMGADVNAMRNLFCEDRMRLDLLTGYRFIRLAENMDVHSYSDTYAGAAAGTTVEIQDTFSTVNFFNGGQVGLSGEYRYDRLYLAGTMKVAFGVDSSELTINGWTRTQLPGGATSTVPYGLLAQSTNSGYSSNQLFAVAPEANFTVGYQINDHWRATVGYTFLYISNVARPGQAIDTSFGTANGINHPIVISPTNDFWMQGINFTIQARF